MARVCNSWKQNCNLSVCTDSLWVLVYLLTYFCLQECNEMCSFEALLWRYPAIKPALPQRPSLPAKAEILTQKKFAPSRPE